VYQKFLSRVFVAEQVDATCEDDTGVHIGLGCGEDTHPAARGDSFAAFSAVCARVISGV
jgi:hypothetical protein